MAEYKLICKNQSRNHGSFALFQSPPNTSSPGTLFTLAWLARPAAPDTRVTFNWTNSYHFVWGETGSLHPGAVFESSQAMEADPLRENTVDLTQDQFGSPMFANLRTGGAPGTLTIRQLNTIFDYPVSVGIGMTDTAAYGVKASSNVTTVFTPLDNVYWLVFGSFTQGEVLDITSLSNPVKISFSTQTPVQTAVLTLDNLIKIQIGA